MDLLDALDRAGAGGCAAKGELSRTAWGLVGHPSSKAWLLNPAGSYGLVPSERSGTETWERGPTSVRLVK